ncbi:MAG: tryptophan--tRNA ligase [Candidatus Omnitrophica bacterium]|nr:tryptophan--tRNA ligase [bacterium]MBK7495554.1 tryptophan--tRNA ligase [Candidatus Omnitrophota bacterium]MCE7906878.1 tryptophan--tRNA ligase [Candidatus Omnitrophica bacterium COP1]MBV6483039.1 Tryptophan--tRNA ligase [bacterium]MBW7937761.1 tryptophan--tRNA ligase [Candidatus Omnitrophota bacterium]
MSRIFSGIRPTGPMHLGNYVGAVSKWVKLQDSYECVYCVVDWHAITTEYENLKSYNLRERSEQKAMELIAAGVDPEKSILFVQSDVPAHVELALLFGMFVPLPWLERVPTYKEQIQNLSGKDLLTYGFLGYPVLQAADILVYKATHVPVGEDQLPHIELAREIARRFNNFYGDLFPEPEAIQSETTRLPGLDNRKMSKSYNNAIDMIDSPEVTAKKISGMITDPQRIRRSDPGNPDVCTVFTYHKVFTPPARTREIDHLCRTAGIGCVECKRELAANVNAYLAEFRERYAEIAARPERLREILGDGAARANAIASRILAEAKQAIGLI